MTPEKSKELVNQLIGQLKHLCETAKTAKRSHKSLNGDNYYSNRFHAEVVTVKANLRSLSAILNSAFLTNEQRELFSTTLASILHPTSTGQIRSSALKAVQTICLSVLIPAIDECSADPVPVTEQVLPMSVVKGTRGYIERVILQANGCYEHQWFDACSVMIRRFIETLIIEVYKAAKRENEIKDNYNNFLMLGSLIEYFLSDRNFSLGRETRHGLPLIKSLGDRSAHNIFFLAKKEDVNKLIHDLRVIADELLGLSRLR